MAEDEINLIDLWRVLLKGRKSVFLISFTVTLIAIFYSFSLSKIYKAECSLMPVSGHSGSAQQALARIEGGALSLGGLMGLNSSSSQILAVIRSKTLTSRVIEALRLIPVLYPESNNETRKLPTLVQAIDLLQSRTIISEDKKSQMITIQVMMNSPEDAALIANGYLDELTKFINENTFTSAKRNRIFLENQLGRNKIELLNSGKELNSFYASNKISNIVPSMDVDVSSHQEESMSESSYEVVQLQKKLESNNSQLKQANIVKDVPQQVYLQYLIIQRELLGRLNALLSQEYEMAKIDESKEDISFQIIDRAMVPVNRFSPHRTKIVLVGFALSLILGIFYVIFRDFLGKNKEN